MDESIIILNNQKKNRPKKRKNKLVILFDEDARREFLTGFHKRKLQRKSKATEEFEMQLKAERKRIKAHAKEQYKKLLLSQKPIPELEDLLSEEIDMGSHYVSVTELSNADLAKKNNWIGINEAQYDEENEKSNEKIVNPKNNPKLEGMEIKQDKKKKIFISNMVTKNHKDIKAIKKAIKEQAIVNVKKSKVFQKKAKLEKIKNIKHKKKQERLKEKMSKIKKIHKRNKYKKK